MSLKEDLIALKVKWRKRIGKEVADLDAKLTKEFVEEMKAVVGDRPYAGYFGDGGVEATAELFANNQIIQHAVWNDVCDWNDGARAEDLEEYIEYEEGC